MSRPKVLIRNKTGIYANFNVTEGHMAISEDGKHIYSPSGDNVAIITVDDEIIENLHKEGIALDDIPVYKPLIIQPKPSIELSGDADHFNVDQNYEIIDGDWDKITLSIRLNNIDDITRVTWYSYNSDGDEIELSSREDNSLKAVLNYESVGKADTVFIRVFVTEQNGRLHTSEMIITINQHDITADGDTSSDTPDVDPVRQVIENKTIYNQSVRTYYCKDYPPTVLRDVIYINNDVETGMQMCITSSGEIHEFPIRKIVYVTGKLNLGE